MCGQRSGLSDLSFYSSADDLALCFKAGHFLHPALRDLVLHEWI